MKYKQNDYLYIRFIEDSEIFTASTTRMVFQVEGIDFECAYCLRGFPAEEQAHFRAQVEPVVCLRCDESLCSSCGKCCPLNEFSKKQRSNFN